MAYEHQIKTVEADQPGYLINKFDSSGRIIITVYTDIISNKISFKLTMNTKDLFEHLLKPTSPSPMVSINDSLKYDSQVMFFPAIFPNGVVESITMLSDNFANIDDFEIACFGNNDANQIEGSTRWFYTNKQSMLYDGKCSYTFRDGNYRSIVPYSYNFIAMKVTFRNGGSLLSNAMNQGSQDRFRTLDTQWQTNGITLSTCNKVPTGLTKVNLSTVPFIQFNLLKAN